MDPITAGIGSLIAFVIFIVTVVSIVKNPNHGGFAKFLWLLVAFFFSIFGSLAWLLFGRGRVRPRS